MADERPVGGEQTIPQYPGEISDPITGSPKWPSSYGGSFPADDADEFTEGDAVNITLPTDALYDGSGLSYEWSGRAPDLRGTNLTWNPSTNTITSGTGGVSLRVAGRPMYITGNWAAVTTDDVDGPDRDLLRFRIDVRPRNPFRFPNTPITVNVHRGRAVSPAASLGTGSGGRRPYRYQVAPGSSARHSSPRSLASMGIAHNTATNQLFTPPGGQVIAPVGTYQFQVRAWDAAALEPLGRTLYIRVDRSALPPEPVAPLTLNGGNDINYGRLLVNHEWNSLLPNRAAGGVPPYRFSFAWDSPPNNGTIRFTQSTGTRGQGSLVRIVGVPSRVGSMSGTFTVRDAAGNRASVAVRLTVLGRRSMPNAVAFTFAPRQIVAENLPQLTNARGAVSYAATGTAGVERLGLRVSASQRTLSGVVVDQPAESDRDVSFLWTATDAGDQFSTAVVVGVPRARLTPSRQNNLTIDEGGKPDHRIVPFGGGTGRITYTAAGLPSGLRIRASGTGYVSIVGTAPQVPADRTWSVNITGTDEVGEDATATMLVTVRDAEAPPPPPGRLSMADAEFSVRDATSTTLTLPAALLDGHAASGITYDPAVHDSGIGSPEVAISDTTLTLRLQSRERDVDDPAPSVWTRTARRQGLTATSKVTINQFGRLFFDPSTPLSRFPGDEVDAVVPIVLRGGASPRSVVLESDFPAGSGVRAGVTQTAVTVRGTAGPVGSYSCRITASDRLGATARTGVTMHVGDRSTFRFLEDRYTITTRPGEDVTWQCPEPINADGGVLSLATVPAPLPADLRQPTLNSAQQWIIEGTVAAPVGSYAHALIATDRAGNEARTQLIVVVQEAGDPEIPDGGGPGGYGGCGPVLINRVPLSGERKLELGSVLPLPGDTGPIQMFRPSAFIVGQQTSITFDWEVLTEYRGVEILEVDLWRTDPDLPYCAGIPNILLVLPGEESTASVPHEVTAGYRTRMPLEPLTGERPSQEYLYRLVALRAGSSEKYLAADWWDVWVRVTILRDDVQISSSKTFVPDGYPVMLQWGYLGRQPTGEQVIMVGERRRAVGELTAASIGPVVDWEPEPGQVDDTREPVLPGSDPGDGTGVIDA